MRVPLVSFLPLVLMFMGCDFFGFGADAGTDAGPDAASDAALDAASDAAADAVVSGPHTYGCQPVPSAGDRPVVSLASFQGQLFIGFRGQNADSLTAALGASIGPGLRGVNSVCAMAVYQEQLYANTASRGEIYRSSDGHRWRRIYPGGANLAGCAIEEFNGRLYALNRALAGSNGHLLRSQTGTTFTQVWSDETIGVDALVMYGERLYALGRAGTRPVWLDTATGVSWRQTRTPGRFLSGREFDGALYLGAGQGAAGPAGIYRYIRGSAQTARLIEPVSESSVAELRDWDGALFAGTASDAGGDGSRLLVSRDGSHWEATCNFEEAAVTALEFHGDALYVGTADADSGRLYRVSITGDL